MLDLLPRLLEGAGITIQITFFAVGLALVVGVAAGLARLSRFMLLRAAVTAYVEFFRGTSILVQLFWLFFVLPHFGVELTPFQTAVLGLGLNYGAYGSEVVRGAILAVSAAQREAASALGLSRFQTMRLVILPQALAAMLPPWGNLMIELLKATALVSLITVTDLAFVAYQLNQVTFRTIEIFTVVLLLYFAMALAITGVVRSLERVCCGWRVKGKAG